MCDFPDEQEAKEQACEALADYVERVNPSIVVLPEMPFCHWIFDGETVDAVAWSKAVKQHDVMISRLAELRCRWVMSSRPVEENGRRFTDYRLRIAEVLRDYEMTNREQAPTDSRAAHEQKA